jgi:putative two-component system response regulator
MARALDDAPVAPSAIWAGTPSRDRLRVVGALRAGGFAVRVARSVPDALAQALSDQPDVMVVDATLMPRRASEMCELLTSPARLMDLPVLVVDVAGTEDATAVISAGAVDCVTRPSQASDVVVRVRTHARLRRLTLDAEQHSRRLEAMVLEHVAEITDSQMATIVALAKLSESRDDQTGGHLERVQRFCRLLAEHLSHSIDYAVIDRTYLDNIEYASALHDIGKVAIADAILLKPGKLTPQELEVMKTHTTLGASTLEAVSSEYPSNDFISMGIKIARWHHERWDGAGYPDGLVGEEMPLCARIMAVADVYDALTSIRSYKPALGHAESRAIIVEGSGTQFDPAVVEAFLALESQFENSAGVGA